MPGWLNSNDVFEIKFLFVTKRSLKVMFLCNNDQEKQAMHYETF
jgi:hypothetical protein